jgi:hypothetical protein
MISYAAEGILRGGDLEPPRRASGVKESHGWHVAVQWALGIAENGTNLQGQRCEKFKLHLGLDLYILVADLLTPVQV